MTRASFLCVALALTSLSLGCEEGATGPMEIYDLNPRRGSIGGEQAVQITGANFRPDLGYMVYFGTEMTQQEAALFELPYQHIIRMVLPERQNNAREAYRKYWWRHGEPRVAMRKALSQVPRFIAVAATSKHMARMGSFMSAR